jgi:hypothetical protein
MAVGPWPDHQPSPGTTVRHLLPTLAAGLLVLTGCRDKPKPVEQLPDEPDGLTVYSIDGPFAYRHDMELTPEQQKGEVLFGYPVLGKVEVTDPAQRRVVVAAIKEAARAQASMAACFIPRHAIRAAKGDRVIQLVICFQCSQYWAFGDDRSSRVGSGLISRDAEPLLDQLLTAAGVPLASKDTP